MKRLTVRLPLSVVDSPSFMTRASLIGLAQELSASDEIALRLAVTSRHLEDGHDIVHAEIELRMGSTGHWCLTYVSHPSSCGGLTEGILLAQRDLEEFADARNRAFVEPVVPICADDLEEEGLGPLAMLNLRPENRFPLVPSISDRQQLLSLLDMNS